MIKTMKKEDHARISAFLPNADKITEKETGIHIKYLSSEAPSDTHVKPHEHAKKCRDADMVKLLMKATRYKSTGLRAADFVRDPNPRGGYGLIVPEKGGFKEDFLQDLQTQQMAAIANNDSASYGSFFSTTSRQQPAATAASKQGFFGASVANPHPQKTTSTAVEEEVNNPDVKVVAVAS